MLASGDRRKQGLAVQACNAALNYGDFVRTAGAEVQGLRTPPVLWRPKSYDEWFLAYKTVWTMLRDAIPALHDEEREEAAGYIIRHAYQLGKIPHLGTLVIDTLGDLAATGLKKRELVDLLEFAVEHLDQIPEENRAAWSSLIEHVHGGASFTGRLSRFVGRARWRNDDTTTQAVMELARQAKQDNKLLISALPWLLTNDAQNAYLFGYQLGKLDEDGSIWSLLLNQLSSEARENVSVVGGYLRANKERDENLWFTHLTECKVQDHVVAALHYLVFQSGLTDDAGRLLAELIEEGRMQPIVLRQFVLGDSIRELSPETFAAWRLLLRNAGNHEMQALIELMDAYYTGSHPVREIPLPETVEILTDERLFAAGTQKSGMLTDHSWRELARAVVAQDPSQITPLAKVVVDNMGIRSAVLQEYGDTGPTIWLREVAKLEPVVIWGLVKGRLGPHFGERTFNLKDLIDTSDPFDENQSNFIDTLPRQELWDWVEADLENRAWYLAYLVSPTIESGSLARDVLIRYGDRKDVQDNLRANFNTEGWSGPDSSYLEGKRLRLETLLATESEPRVREWMASYIEELSRRIETAKVREERDY